VDIIAEIWNASGVPAGSFEVTVYSDHPDSGGTPLMTEVLNDLYGWEKRALSFTLEEVEAGDLDLHVVADASGVIPESDEANNIVQRSWYVYPCEWGYPLKLGDDIEGQVVSDLDNDGDLDLLISSGGTQALALDMEGNTLWLRDDLGLPQWHPDIQPSAFDLNGDGTTEAILTTRSSVLVADGATGTTIWQRYTEYPAVSPVVSDLDADGSFDIVAGTYTSPFSRIHALDASGTYIWVYDVPGFGEKLTGIVVCDVDLDSKKEVIYSTDEGNLKCLSCITNPPTTLWEVPLVEGEVTCIVGGDMERDGTIEIIAGTESMVYILDGSTGGEVSSIPMSVCVAEISLGNLDADLALEIVCASDCGRLLEIDDGSIAMDIDAGGTPIGAPILGDVDQDGSIEIVSALAEGIVRIVQPSGTDLIPPIPMKGSCLSGPMAHDIDGDGNIEILAGSSDSLLFVLDLGMAGGRLEWLCEGCTGTRTGLYAQPFLGAITGDVILTDRIDVVGDVLIDSTGSLTFGRGSDVRLVHDGAAPIGESPGFCELDVDGEIISVGSATGLITLRPIAYPCQKDEWMGILLNENASATLTHTHICGAITAVECNASEAYISECVITGSTLGIKITDAAPLIDNNLITGNTYGINSNDSSPIIVGNLISGNTNSGLVLSNSSLAVLDHNTIEKTQAGHGLACYSSSPNILGGNEIKLNSQAGIYLSNSSPVIDSCWIGWNGDCGIKAAYYSDPTISKTSIVSNRIGIGIYVYADPVLGDSALGIGGQNDIRGNDMYAVYNTTTNEIKAHMTWWGQDPPDPAEFRGPIDFAGWLGMPPAGIEDDAPVTALVSKLSPNPFSSQVWLSLEVGQEHLPVDVSVYDIRGRLLQKIVAVDSPGEVRAGWDGRDAHGNPVASGTYFLTVTSRSRVHTTKLILVR
jgi:parallel beta-helix repeat protein